MTLLDVLKPSWSLWGLRGRGKNKNHSEPNDKKNKEKSDGKGKEHKQVDGPGVEQKPSTAKLSELDPTRKAQAMKVGKPAPQPKRKKKRSKDSSYHYPHYLSPSTEDNDPGDLAAYDPFSPEFAKPLALSSTPGLRTRPRSPVDAGYSDMVDPFSASFGTPPPPPPASERAKEFKEVFPCRHFLPDRRDLETMSSPSSWTFYLPSIPGIPSDRAQVVGNTISIRASHARELDANVALVTALPIPWTSPDVAHVEPPPGILYFEVTVVRKAPDATVAIGLATTPYPCFRLPGWHEWSVGYHSNQGRVFVSDDLASVPYGNPFGEGDTVGLGVETRTGKVFFALNGQRMPSVEGADVPSPRLKVTPCVGANGKCVLETNFGARPFKWREANEVKARYSLELMPSFFCKSPQAEATPVVSLTPSFPPTAIWVPPTTNNQDDDSCLTVDFQVLE